MENVYLESLNKKCDSCGGHLENYSYGVLKCPYCQKIFNVNKTGLNENLFFDAQRLVKENKFAEAIEKYNEILKIDENFPEANWGYILCELGVEYVKSGDKSFPSIHRFMRDFSIFEDFHAKKLLEHTYGLEKQEYERKLKELDDLRIEIQNEVKNQKDYDIFISCKISSNQEGKEFAEEAKWGKEAYEYFVKRGYKVFYSPNELPKMIGNYEPKIYAALQSSELMLVLGSSRENVESKWVYNEWKRFLEIIKREKETGVKHTRNIKPIYSKECASNRPLELQMYQEAIYDEKGKWLKNIEEAIIENNLCPNHSDIPVITSVDLKSASNRRTRFLKKKEEVVVEDVKTVLRNPYADEITLMRLSENFDEDKDAVEQCLTDCDIFLSGAHFAKTEARIKEYKRDYAYDGEPVNYQILFYKMMADVQATSKDDFFDGKIVKFSDFNLFEEMIQNLPNSEALNFLDPFIKYIKKEVNEVSSSNAVEIYKIISKLDIESVCELHKYIAAKLRYYYNKPDILDQYASISLPYIAKVDGIEIYIDFTTELASSLCSHESYKEALKLANDVLEIDNQNAVCNFVKLRAEHNTKDVETLLNLLEEENNFDNIEELLRLFNNNYSRNHFIDFIKSHINNLLDKREYESAVKWLRIIEKYNFSDREEYFKGILDKCLERPKSIRVFELLVETITDDKLDEYIDYMIKFIETLYNNKRYDDAKELAATLIEYDPENGKCLQLWLFSEIESFNRSYQNIYKLKNFEIIERILVNQDTSTRSDYLNRYVNECIKYVDSKGVEADENIFAVFDRLIKYYKNITDDVLDRIYKFANATLKHSMFERATYYYRLILSVNIKFHQAYYGLLKSNNNFKNDDELINGLKKPLKDIADYKLALEYSVHDNKARTKYLQLVTSQEEIKRKKLLPIILLVGGAVVVAAIAVVAIILLGK